MLYVVSKYNQRVVEQIEYSGKHMSVWDWDPRELERLPRGSKIVSNWHSYNYNKWIIENKHKKHLLVIHL